MNIYVKVINSVTSCNLLIQITFLLLIGACNSGSAIRHSHVNANTITIPINNINISPEYAIDTLVKLCEIIPLETKDQSLMGNITGIYAVNDRIIVFDKYNAKSILIFSAKGKFINKISPAGKGPGEFLSGQAYLADENGIQVYDGGLSKIVQYDLDGKFKGEYRLTHFYKTDFICYDNGKYLFYNAGEPTIGKLGFKLIIWNAVKNKSEKLFFPFDEKSARCKAYIGEKHFAKIDNDYIFYELFNDTIFNFNAKNNSVVAKYIFDFKKGALPPGFTSNHEIIDKQGEIDKYAYAAFAGRYTELADYLLFKYNYKQVEQTFVWHKKSNKPIANTYLLGHDKLALPVLNWYKGFNENQIIVTYESYELIDWLRELRKNKHDLKSNPVAKVVNTLHADDNPVLLALTFK